MAKPKDDFLMLQENDAIDSYFECITACSLGEDGAECVTECLEVHLKGVDD